LRVPFDLQVLIGKILVSTFSSSPPSNTSNISYASISLRSYLKFSSREKVYFCLPIPSKNWLKSIKVLSKVSYSLLSIFGLMFGTTTLWKVSAMNLPTGFKSYNGPVFFFFPDSFKDSFMAHLIKDSSAYCYLTYLQS
jgi:hypothetical protein